MDIVQVEKVLSIVPAQQVSNAVDRVKILAAIVRQLHDSVLVKDMDYGTIPGTGDKPTLLLPGMEKLMRALNAVPEYIERRVIVDYDKPLFHYEYECRLIEADTGIAIPGGRGLGLCTSFESAFRWRKAERLCPECGKAAIIKGKDEYGGGWLCFKKKDGCGAKFSDGDKRIEDQQAGRVENPDIFDQINAIMKRAKKRSLGDAIKGAANVSEYFTVDLEDLPTMHFDEPIIITTPEPEAEPEAAKSPVSQDVQNAVDGRTGTGGGDSASTETVIEFVSHKVKYIGGGNTAYVKFSDGEHAARLYGRDMLRDLSADFAVFADALKPGPDTQTAKDLPAPVRVTAVEKQNGSFNYWKVTALTVEPEDDGPSHPADGVSFEDVQP